MSDDWDVYFCKVDDRPASIRVNLGIVSEAPLEHLDICAYVRITIQSPDENGFVKPDEFPRLAALEDTLVNGLTQDEDTLFVGCCTTNGIRDFIFFTDDEDSWQDRVAALLKDHPQYTFEAGAHEDSTWAGYFEFLYPTPYDMEIIQNRRVCQMLQEQGDDLEKIRIIDHLMTFSSQENAQIAAKAAEAEGFTVINILPLESDNSDVEFQLALQRLDSPAQINEVSLRLLAIAEDADGNYNGWGTTPADA